MTYSGDTAADITALQAAVAALSAGTVQDLNTLTAGESTMRRRDIFSTAVTISNGTLRMTYFTAVKSETITQVRTISGTTPGVAATLQRIGVFSVDPTTGDHTLVASTANDTALWVAASTRYTKSFSSSFSKVAGTRYAVGILVVGSTTAPTFCGQNAANLDECAVAPRISGATSGNTDLPGSPIAAGSVTNVATQIYAALLP